MKDEEKSERERENDVANRENVSGGGIGEGRWCQKGILLNLVAKGVFEWFSPAVGLDLQFRLEHSWEIFLQALLLSSHP